MGHLARDAKILAALIAVVLVVVVACGSIGFLWLGLLSQTAFGAALAWLVFALVGTSVIIILAVAAVGIIADVG